MLIYNQYMPARHFSTTSISGTWVPSQNPSVRFPFPPNGEKYQLARKERARAAQRICEA